MQQQQITMLQLFMQTDHDRLVEEIQRKMSGAAMLKSEEQKKQAIFQYGNSEEENYNTQNQVNVANDRIKDLISSSQAEHSLQEIYNFYVNSYIQPRKHFDTFDLVNERRLTFQPFILFMKNFRLLKIIFPLEKVKLFFKKFSNFGQYLTNQNFIFMIKQMSHEPEAKAFFNIDQIKQKQQLDLESLEEIERQLMYNYLNLSNPDKFKLNFHHVFQPFLCKSKIDTNKIKYTYRKFSQPELLKKSLPKQNNKTQQKELYVVKNTKQVQVEENPFSQVKSIVVSWESLRSKSTANIQKTSAEIVRKKYVKEDPDEDNYLRQYEEKQAQSKKRLQKKINELTKQEANKNVLFLAKLQQKTIPKTSTLKSKVK